MLVTLKQNMKYCLDINNKLLIDHSENKKYTEIEISNVDTQFYGYKTQKSFQWYVMFHKLNIDLAYDVRKYVNQIEINKCGTYSTLMSSHLVQTKEAVIIKHGDEEYAVLFRFGYLAISKYGKIIDIYNKTVFKNSLDDSTLKSDAYRYYYLHSCEYIVHRLIAEAWLYNTDPINKPQINHKDGNKQNNYLDNLEWVSASENVTHLFKTNLSSQNILAKIRHRYTKEIKEFYSISDMCRYLNITFLNADFFRNSQLGYLYSDYEIRITGDVRDWYYKNGNEPEVPKEATFRFDVYKNGTYDNTFFKASELNTYLGMAKKTKFTITQHMLIVNNSPYRVEVIKLAKTGPYDIKNLETDKIITLDTISEISKYLNYNESSIRMVINTDKSLLGHAIKTSDSEWSATYKAVINTTVPKQIKITNSITKIEHRFNSIVEACRFLNVNTKTFRRYLINGLSFNNWTIETN